MISETRLFWIRDFVTFLLFNRVVIKDDARCNNFPAFFLLCISTNILESLKLKL